MAPVSVSMSPTGDFLATTHIDSLGIYLWSVIAEYPGATMISLTFDVVSQSQSAVSPQDQ